MMTPLPVQHLLIFITLHLSFGGVELLSPLPPKAFRSIVPQHLASSTAWSKALSLRGGSIEEAEQQGDSSGSDAMRGMIDDLMDDEDEPENAKFGWNGRFGVPDASTVCPDDSYPLVKAIGMKATSYFRARGLPEAIQTSCPGDKLLLRRGVYRWHRSGLMQNCQDLDQAVEEELDWDPIVVPFPLQIAGQREPEPLGLSGIYDASRTQHLSVRLSGQWLLTSLEGERGKTSKQGVIDNVLCDLRTLKHPTNMFEVRGGVWGFKSCQLRGAGGTVAMSLLGSSKVSLESCGVGGAGSWEWEAFGGITAYEKSEVVLNHSTVEWTDLEGQGIRLWDQARAEGLNSQFQFNGLDVAFNLQTSLTLRNCSFKGSEVAALWAMGLVEQASVSVKNCTFWGLIWRPDAARDALPKSQPANLTAQTPGFLDWASDNLHLEPIFKPRTWKPETKLETVTFDYGEEAAWSSTDTLEEDIAGAPWVYESEEVEEFEDQATLKLELEADYNSRQPRSFQTLDSFLKGL